MELNKKMQDFGQKLGATLGEADKEEISERYIP